MIKLHASFSSKVPGRQDYSSDCASASVEIEIADNSANIPAKLAELWDITRSAVQHQLGQRQQAPVNRVAQHNNGGNGNGSHAPQGQRPANRDDNYRQNNAGNGRGKAAISEKQLKFIKSLVGELKPMGVDFPFVESVCQRLFQRDLDYLDRAQASTLIGHLTDIKDGRVTVQQLTS